MTEFKIKNEIEKLLIQYFDKENVDDSFVNKVYDDYFKDENITSEEDIFSMLDVIKNLFKHFIDDSEFDDE